MHPSTAKVQPNLPHPRIDAIARDNERNTIVDCGTQITISQSAFRNLSRNALIARLSDDVSSEVPRPRMRLNLRQHPRLKGTHD
jgi:hypothetical protein